MRSVRVDESIAAAEVLQDFGAIETPLVPLNWGPNGKPATFANLHVYLKLESLQPISSFKIRGAGNAIASFPHATKFVTASAGNMAQGIAYCATAKQNIPSLAIVPDSAPSAKCEAIQQFGGKILKVPFAEWWKIILTSNVDEYAPDCQFIHPVCSQQVLAGNSTISLELMRQCPPMTAVVAPYGGGGLVCGIASILDKNISVYSVEPSTACPLASYINSQEMQYESSFIDGCGGKCLLEPMKPLAKELVTGALTVTPEETASAIHHLAKYNKIIAEGAGAVSVAAVMNGKAGNSGHVVCIVSGGGINMLDLINIFQGKLPS